VADTSYQYIGETFYFPHNVDFRGRAYPVPPHLSHIGDDLCRGLLLFKEGRPLGERGLRWLKIHLASMHGASKVSHDDREKYTMDHLDDIFDSADNPLNGRRWWLKAEDAWQCLAACKELTKALRSPIPEEFVSRLPVHQDGTCNGLQHYAALGGDQKGAEQVNLEPLEKPADVYTGVANLVSRIIDEEAAQNIPQAVMLKGKITRKVVKQTVRIVIADVCRIGLSFCSDMYGVSCSGHDDGIWGHVYWCETTDRKAAEGPERHSE
jgi:DNA-directed RNA polymerase